MAPRLLHIPPHIIDILPTEQFVQNCAIINKFHCTAHPLQIYKSKWSTINYQNQTYEINKENSPQKDLLSITKQIHVAI